MPKEISHIHIAEITADRCHPELKRHIVAQKRVFCFGSIAPDLFYYDSQPWFFGERSLISWGEIIHGRDAEDTMLHVIGLLDQSRQLQHQDANRSSQLLAFAAGFLTHIAADTIFHPYVYAATGNYYAADPHERKHAESRHRLFETCMDFHILSLRGESLTDFGLSERIALQPSEADAVLHGYATALHAHAGYVDVGHVKRMVRRAHKKAMRIIRLFQHPTLNNLGVRLNRLLNGRLDAFANAGYGPHRAKDLLNFEQLPNLPHPVTGEQMVGGDLRDLVEKSALRGMRFVDASFEYYTGKISLTELRSVLRPYSLNNGLEGVRTDSMQYSRVLPALLSR